MPKKKNQPRLPSVSPDVHRDAADRRTAAAQVMREQGRKDRRRRVLVQSAIAVVAVVAVLGVTFAVLSRDGSDTAGGTPTGLTSDGAVRFGAADAPVTVQVIEDFQCPVCEQFESANGDLLKSWREGQDVAVEYRPIAFLDRMSSTDYSSRALNASMCVLEDAGPDAWLAMHGALYAQQPAEGGAGLDDDALVQMATDAGADGDAVASCIDDRPYDDWAKDATDAAFATGINGTPSVMVDGKVVPTEDMQSAVQAALDEAGR